MYSVSVTFYMMIIQRVHNNLEYLLLMFSKIFYVNNIMKTINHYCFRQNIKE